MLELREDLEPRPRMACPWILALQHVRHHRTATTSCLVGGLERTCPNQPLAQGGGQALRQHQGTVFRSLDFTDDDRGVGKIDILDPTLQALTDAHAHPVQELDEQAMLAVQQIEDPCDLVRCKHYWQAAKGAGPAALAHPRQRHAQHCSTVPQKDSNAANAYRWVETGTRRSFATANRKSLRCRYHPR